MKLSTILTAGTLGGIAAVITAIAGLLGLFVSNDNNSSDNGIPTSNAGKPQTVYEGDNVILDGSGSIDKDGRIVEYQWMQIQGIDVKLSSDQIVNPKFQAPEISADSVLKFKLTVTDNIDKISPPDYVTITIKNIDKVPISKNKSITPIENEKIEQTGINDSLSRIETLDSDDSITLMSQASFIPENMRNPSLKIFTHSVKVWVEASPLVLQNIKNITYLPEEKMTSSNHPDTKYSLADKFVFSLNAFDNFEIKAKINFKDGKTKNISKNILIN